jgi:hypothetical protein
MRTPGSVARQAPCLRLGTTQSTKARCSVANGSEGCASIMAAFSYSCQGMRCTDTARGLQYPCRLVTCLSKRRGVGNRLLASLAYVQNPCRAAHSSALTWCGTGHHRCGQTESGRGSRASERRAVTCGADPLLGYKAACHTVSAKGTRPTQALTDTSLGASVLLAPGNDPMVYTL